MSVAPERAVCGTCGRVFSSGERFCPFDRTDLNPTPSTPTDPLVGTVLSGSYTLMSRLGAGGMGVVYRARQNRLHRDVAVKILSAQLGADEKAQERFRAEALAVIANSRIRTRSPSTTSARPKGACCTSSCNSSTGSRCGCAWRVLPSVSERRPSSPRRCASRWQRHTRKKPQIVHRDVKPANVMIRRQPDGEEFATVIDFGLAQKLADSDRMTASGLIVGTPAYMAPEQARADGPLDTRVDIYAVGVLLHEMIAGRQPFSAPNPTALLYKHVWEPPPALTSVRPDLNVPIPLERLVLEMLAKDPNDRPQSAALVRARLMEIIKRLPSDSAAVSTPTLVAPLATAPTGYAVATSVETQEATPHHDPPRLSAVPTSSGPTQAPSFSSELVAELDAPAPPHAEEADLCGHRSHRRARRHRNRVRSAAR